MKPKRKKSDDNKRPAMKITVKKHRRCLGEGCGVIFLSDGAGNRMCRRCLCNIANNGSRII